MPSLENVFEFLFKYRMAVFSSGELTLATSRLALLVLLLLAVLGVAVIVQYGAVRGASSRDRLVLGGLRAAILLLLLFCLARPALLVPTAVPLQNFVGVLLDDSLSMRIGDLDGNPRAAFVGQAFGDTESALFKSLAERFKLRFFRFADTTERLTENDEMSYQGDRTHLSRALDTARRQLASLPLSGLVLITDGADNSPTGVEESVGALRDRHIPVFTVGLGRERFERDIEIARIEAPRTMLSGSTAVADVMVQQRGFNGRSTQLVVEDDNGVLSTHDVDFPDGGEGVVVQARFTTEGGGPRLLRFRITPDREDVTQNNERLFLVNVKDQREKILYFEGEPRFEVAFLRRAIAADDNLQLVVLQRTADNKFLRLNVDHPDELLAGFPTTREELFAYRGLIIGSVEADFFTADQQRMLADFVSQRGGGLLMLGGRDSFAEGGYASTPLKEVLPVILEEKTGAGEAERMIEVTVRPTLFGRGHPVTRINEAEDDSIWSELPQLTVVNRIHRTRAGAATLLEGFNDVLAEPQVILASQRYGSGKAIAFTVQDSWLWQMHHSVPLEDLSHETLWQQMLRWLVTDVTGQVRIRLTESRHSPGQSVELVAEVKDDTFLEVNDALVEVRVRTPAGEIVEFPMQWSVQVDGRYLASFTPQEEGFYEIDLKARAGQTVLGSDRSFIEAAPMTDEYFGAEMRRAALTRIAEETGGRFYTPATVDRLAEDLRHTEGGTTVLEHMDLWDMPVVFLLLLGLISGEWLYRRRRQLA